ncbi:hypothetical protein [Nonomuraea sp. NPDC002799]
MSLFTSQFDQAREAAREYAGDASETRFWIPAAAAVAGAAALTAVDAAATEGPAEWGAGWDDGWHAVAAPPEDAGAAVDDGGAWSHRGDYTDASVGGDGDFFYFIDGDSSLTIG